MAIAHPPNKERSHPFTPLPPPITNMQPTISIPQDWDYPRFVPGQWTKQGRIIGMEYNPEGTLLAHEYGQGWRYAVLPDKNSQQVFYYSDDQIQQLSVAEIQALIQAEIEQHQQQIAALQQQLAGATNNSQFAIRNSQLRT